MDKNHNKNLFENIILSAEHRIPLAARMRPRTISEILGQDRILGPGKLLRRAIETDRLTSIILFGPPGCGKTSLAEVIAIVTNRHFERTSGVISNVAELRSILDSARIRAQNDGLLGKKVKGTILFVDELHRLNKAQQEVFLPYVEDGCITLIGTTAHNPMFFITPPLLSRSLVFELESLSESTIITLLKRAITDERGFGKLLVKVSDDALRHLARMSEGDARRALNALEIAILSTRPDNNGEIKVELQDAEASIQKKAVVYDHDEDGHYDTISAFIKSVRGSDPDAAIYWLAKMLYAGEDPRFIARRLVILASEDIGNADPSGLSLAVAGMQAVEFVGMPEARIILAQVTTYLATAPKSNASFLAIEKASSDVKAHRTMQVPQHLKNVKLKTVEDNKNSQDEYIYPHAYEHHFVSQEYMLGNAKYYIPSGEGNERLISKRMLMWEQLRTQHKQAGKDKSADKNE